MSLDSPTDKDKFDAILRRLIATKPQTQAETKAKAKEQRKAKKAKASRLDSK
jgi:hypothetical protein